MDLRKLKDKAAETFSKGKFAKAAELYEEYCQKDPKDHLSRMRLGDARAKAGDKPKAILAYKTAAEGFAREGFLPRAIAASKIVLELDPQHQGVQQILADLYARKGGGPAAPKAKAALTSTSPAIQPAAPTPAPEVFVDDGPAVLVDPEPILAESASGLPPELDLELVQPPASPKPVSDLARSASKFDELDLDVESLWNAPVGPTASATIDSTVAAGGTLLHAVTSAARSAPKPAFEEEILLDDVLPEGMPRIPLFSDLPPDAFVALFDLCPLLRRAQAERVFEQGSVGNAFYVVCGGEVAVLREDENGLNEIARLGEGAFFGEMALLSGEPRTATVQSANDDTQLLEISAPVLAELAQKFPQIAEALRKFCQERMLANVMRFSPLFKPFEKEARETLVSRFKSRDVGPGHKIIQEGIPADGLYIILSGQVDVTKEGKTLAHLREGEIFGEMSLLTKTPATATVKATRPTSVLRLPRSDFDALIRSHPQVLALISELTDDRKRQTEAVLSGAAVVGDEGVMLV